MVNRHRAPAESVLVGTLRDDAAKEKCDQPVACRAEWGPMQESLHWPSFLECPIFLEISRLPELQPGDLAEAR